ncbi:Uncharacterised protein [Mycobacteroides abscessus subsp. abscessus]|nr:Uncharacterised protein [Mycobacteroides abscessus subsp. abscessus]SHW44691.1 Uncharacterised protein [Mycobacteroides abscessus subsp. abscessus]SIH64405.1 Uncharacterised protein [Mycobacteroides abscessus subsp. abscessus]SKD15620.1 Uncharacterised protein [Mycobacteroides abscessus subsp. abscessus]SKN03894.1 Uncharacterised protein [Mycobacteroides abscessus subsp. abscessus]
MIAGAWISAWLVIGSAPVTAAADPGEHSHQAGQSSRKPSRSSDDSGSRNTRQGAAADTGHSQATRSSDTTSHSGKTPRSDKTSPEGAKNSPSQASGIGSRSSRDADGSVAKAPRPGTPHVDNHRRVEGGDQQKTDEQKTAGSPVSRVAVRPPSKAASPAGTSTPAEVAQSSPVQDAGKVPSRAVDSQNDLAATAPTGRAVSQNIVPRQRTSVSAGMAQTDSGSALGAAAAPVGTLVNGGNSVASGADTARVAAGATAVQDSTSNAPAVQPNNGVVSVPKASTTVPSLKTLLSTRLLLTPNGSLPKLPTPVLTPPDLRLSAGLIPNPAVPTWSIKPMVDLSWPKASAGLVVNTPIFSAAATLSLTLPTLSFPTTAPSTTTTAVNALQPPTPADAAETPYGQIGKWMINSDGRIANWIGRPLQGRTLYEPVNVVLVDRSSTSEVQARDNLIATLGKAGFPNYLAHSSTGYSGTLGDSVYGQYPNGLMQVFSNGPFYVTNDHGRVFGPSPTALPDGSGYLWSMSISRETGYLDGRPRHEYATFEGAEADLAQGLRGAGVVQLPSINLDNVYNTPTITTGDNDGNASVFDISSPILAAAAMCPVVRRRPKGKV